MSRPSALVSLSRAASAALVLLALSFGAVFEARADQVDVLIERMRRSRDYKVRLSAALNLSKLREKRAIPAFLDALGDADKTVRGVAAAALGKLVDGEAKPALRARTEAALANVVESEKDAFVRKQAKQALARVRAAGRSSPEGRGVYVHIGPMSDKAGADLTAVMKKTAQTKFAKSAAGMATSWPGGKLPTQSELDAKSTAGFYVDGTLVALDVETTGSSAKVSCEVSMLIATFPDKSMFGFLKGGASVQSSASPRDVGYAREDCVVAVVEDLVERKIIPAIKQRIR